MKKNHGKVTFKPYSQEQAMLLPPSLEELIPGDHMVRVVNRVVDEIDISALIAKYKGGGTSAYHPRMMLKVLVYAYVERIYSSRGIAKAMRENVNFMWLSGMNRPDFRTINGFRGERMKGVIEEVFGSVVEVLVREGYIQLENYYLDGTKIEANANKHRVVWAKRNRKYQERLREQVKEILEEVERVNEEENEKYGDQDLPELGEGKTIDSERLQKTIDELNERLRNLPEDPELRGAVEKMEKNYLVRQRKYEEQVRKLDGRNSYAMADEDATSMRMKEDRGAEKPWAKPAYNVQLGTENQFVIGFSLYQRAGDTSCLIPHLDGLQQNLGRLPRNIIADAGYGSEENYAYLADHQLGNFVKYNTFHREQIKHRKPELIRKKLFRSESFPYDETKDEFICPADKRLTYRHTRSYKTENGYQSERRVYECDHCQDCDLKPECTQAKGNRRMYMSFRLRQFRAQARSNLLSEAGKALRCERITEVETVFGQIKHNQRFRRFMLRGLQKTKTEWGLLCLAHNIKKLAVH
ncbi:MAG: IS1182 family transposase [Nitrospirota bacterium]|nr:MAG: IS1182 family transposase [Nitrospirota bacterium]